MLRLYPTYPLTPMPPMCYSVLAWCRPEYTRRYKTVANQKPDYAVIQVQIPRKLLRLFDVDRYRCSMDPRRPYSRSAVIDQLINEWLVLNQAL